MNLSTRAETYLRTLRRGNSVPVSQVREALKRTGCPVFDIWLEFHSRFAGYEETIGNEIAVWGIVHSEPYWLVSNEVTVESDQDGWRVICADVHPSYDYWLDSKGQFVGLGNGGPFETFEVKVERDAMIWEAAVQERSWAIDFELSEAAGGIKSLRHSVPELVIVPEASDRYSTCWRSPEVIVIERQQRIIIWVASDARERIRRLFQKDK